MMQTFLLMRAMFGQVYFCLIAVNCSIYERRVGDNRCEI